MDYAAHMSIAQSFQHLRDYTGGYLVANWPFIVYFVAQGSPGDEFHHKVVTAIVFAEREKTRQVRVIQSSHRDGFLKETLFDYRVARVLFMKLFDGHDATGRMDVFGFEDRAEASAANVIRYLVITDSSAAHNRAPLLIFQRFVVRT